MKKPAKKPKKKLIGHVQVQDAAMLTAVEFGHRCCEKGDNIQATLAKAQKVLAGGSVVSTPPGPRVALLVTGEGDAASWLGELDDKAREFLRNEFHGEVKDIMSDGAVREEEARWTHINDVANWDKDRAGCPRSYEYYDGCSSIWAIMVV